MVTDAGGAEMERQAFDPWGDRRIASGTDAGGADPQNALQASTTTLGYTGHEQLDQRNMGLIHMNGQVYDPTLARFISADPKVQVPYHTQSMNRYSYVWNGPLNATDPSGYIGIITTVPVQGQALVRGMGFSLACRNSGCLAPLNELQEALQPPRTSLLQKGVRDLQLAARGAKNLARIIRNSPFMKKVEGQMQGSLGLVSMPLYLLQLPLLQAAVDQVRAEDDASNGLDIAGEGTNSGDGAKTGDNTNPYKGPVDQPVVVVDEHGNAIPVKPGEQVKGSPNGDYQQVLGPDGKPTGDRLDRGGHKNKNDPRAQEPHGHRPGVTTPDGNPHLPIYH